LTSGLRGEKRGKYSGGRELRDGREKVGERGGERGKGKEPVGGGREEKGREGRLRTTRNT